HLDAAIVLSRRQVSLGLYPAIDPLASNSSLLTPDNVGQEHYAISMQVRALLARYEELQDVIAILGIEELNDVDRTIVHRARRLQRFLTQPFTASESFTGIPGEFLPLQTTLDSFKQIIDGHVDQLPEQAFYMVGSIEQVIEKAEWLEKQGVEVG
ncbi:MAG: F0F1 ATP synthase subunit beta, partial [Anaerolineae bacterium]|nr:F0F1 ATP synthase subunit beta [Anaerolineae bacterium]